VSEGLFGKAAPQANPEKLFQAMDELENLARWLDLQLEDLGGESPRH